MKLLTKLKFIVTVNKSDLPIKDKSLITIIILTHNLEKSLPLILKVLGAAAGVFKIFSQWKQAP